MMMLQLNQQCMCNVPCQFVVDSYESLNNFDVINVMHGDCSRMADGSLHSMLVNIVT